MGISWKNTHFYPFCKIGNACCILEESKNRAMINHKNQKGKRMKAQKGLIGILFLLLINTTALIAQSDTPPTGLVNEDLRIWLKTNWYNDYQDIPSGSSGYTQARLAMYNNIEKEQDTMYCLYSGYGRYVPSNGFSSAGEAMPFDCEHIVPQSFFGSEYPMKNDIHHLAPTYSNWNSTRGNNPFNEIPDGLTEKWIRLNESVSCEGNAPCIPISVIDEYSELITSGSNFWEPREDAKGDVARAVFYFYTMYPDYNIEEVGNIDVLYQWHLADAVNEGDIERNDMVADFQGNRNPYIAHPEWVYLAWMADIDVSVTPTNPDLKDNFWDVKIANNPIRNQQLNAFIYQPYPTETPVAYTIYNATGKVVQQQKIVLSQQENPIQIALNNINDGIYWLAISNKENKITSQSFLVIR